MSLCQICSLPLDDGTNASLNCGGDCAACMAQCDDPDCVDLLVETGYTFKQIGQGARKFPHVENKEVIAMNERWRPMAEAPRDGTHVLLLRKHDPENNDVGKQYLTNVPHCFVSHWYPKSPVLPPHWPPRWVTPHEGAGPWTDEHFDGWMHLPERD